MPKDNTEDDDESVKSLMRSKVKIRDQKHEEHEQPANDLNYKNPYNVQSMTNIYRKNKLHEVS